MELFLFFAPFYALAFLALFAVRQPAWLTGGAVAASVLIVILYRLLQQGGGGESALGGYVAIIITALGFAVGATARIAVILARARWPDKVPAAPVGLLFFFGVPLAIIGWSQLREAQHRRRYAPPSLECMARLHELRLGDLKLRVPLVPGVTVGEGTGHSPRVSTAIPEQERVFCERTANSKIRVTNIAIDVSQLGANPHLPPRPICRRPLAEAWWPLWCRTGRPPRVDLYGIYLVDPERYDLRAFPDYRVNRHLGEAAPLDRRWERVGPLARLDGGWEIFWRGPRMPAAASAWSARCYRNKDVSQQPDGWRCKAGYMLTPRVALIYSFLTPDDDFVSAALGTEDRVSQIARSLIANDRTVPARR